ncbi:MAG: HD-GYP domain-containing protein [Magnetococcales bacterium]|nr:HD-GYP domain-containing protein [Magnetococcales bacterium]
MIKLVATRQLEPGMFVHDFNHEWRDPCCQDKDPNAFRGQKMLETEAQVMAIIAHGIQELYIDTERGRDVQDAPTAKEVEASLERQMMELGDDDDEYDDAPSQEVTFDQEINKASEIKHQARAIVGDVLGDVRLGKQVEVGAVKDVVRNMTESMFRNQDAMLSLSLLKQKDDYTFLHSVNVGVFLMSFCRGLGYSEEEVVDVGVGGLLHDVGKMRTPPNILNKPGRLTDEEFLIMKNHVVYSRKILEKSPGISEISMLVASQHHERYDGSGYPEALKGDQINLFGQMAAIVDVYDAITSDRCYHKGNPPYVALKRMLEWSKFHFNSELYQSFIQVVGIYPIGSLVRLKNNLLGVVTRPNKESLLHPVIKVVVDAKKKKKLVPKDVDLMSYKGKEAGDGFRILRHENPAQWGVDPVKFMPDPKLFK